MPPFSLKNLSLFASLYDGWIGQPSRLEQTRNLFSILSFSHRKVTLILLWFYLHFGWPNVGRGWDRNENLPNGREPWSSGYGRRLMSKDRGFKSLHRILDGHFSHLFVVKFVLFVWKDKNKRKSSRGWPFLYKKLTKYLLIKLFYRPFIYC